MNNGSWISIAAAAGYEMLNSNSNYFNVLFGIILTIIVTILIFFVFFTNAEDKNK